VRILHVIHSVDPRSGGPSHAIRAIAREQSRLGHRVAVITTTIQSAEPWEDRSVYRQRMLADPSFGDVELIVGTAFGRRRPWSQYGFSSHCSRWLRNRMSDPELSPSVVHIHGVFSHLTSAAAYWARRYRIPYIIRPAGSLDEGCFQAHSHHLKKAFARLFLKKDLSSASCIQVTAETEAAQLRKWVPSEKIRLVPHGVDIPPLQLIGTTNCLVSRFPEIRNRTVVLFMGRVNSVKRLNLLIDAIALLRRDYPDLLLLVCGHDAGHMSAIRKQIELLRLADAVILTGFLSGELKWAAFAEADVFVLPSMHENFGVAVVEAMAFGVPVVVTPQVASHVYVDDSGAGITVQGNAESIADGIERVLSCDSGDLGQLGRSYAHTHLSWTTIVRELESIYRSLIAVT
jgi:glycosyltransferase involved in cell wall biosynthesis